MNPPLERRDLGEEELLTRETALFMPHLAASGKRETKMLGQIIRHRDQLVFHHAHSGSQYHRKYDCPAPLDLKLVALLHRSDIALVYCYDRQRSTLWRTDTERLKNAHIAFYDGRNR